MPAKFSKPYSRISEVYIHLMRYIDYKGWSEYIYSVSKPYLPEDPKVLELASGGCELARHLKKYYTDITVTDVVPQMLSLASGEQFTRICCDMRKLPFKKKFNFIFSAFDSINYLMHEEELFSVFGQVYELLDQGGVFSFDVSTEYNSIRNSRYLNRSGTYNGIVYEQTSRYDKNNKVHSNGFRLVYPDGSEAFELHEERIYPVEIFFELLIDAGFVVKECYDAFTLKDASAKSERVQFLARK